MMSGKKPQSGARRYKDQLITLKEATEETIDDLSSRITNVEAQFENRLKDQRSENKNIIIGVLVAVALIIASVAATVIYANYLTGNEFNNRFDFNDELNKQQIQLDDLQNSVSNLKIRNPYLK